MTDVGNEQNIPLPEHLVLAALGRGNQWLRAVLCTLARRGIAFRTAQPERARYILELLAPLPLYKGGQFLFDLMEWEDFMLDGQPPPIVPTTFDAHAMARLIELLNTLSSALDGARVAGATPNWDFSHINMTFVNDDELPPIEGGFYLYPDVVLGLVMSAAPLLLANSLQS
jgi:hypothetical protein